MVNIFSTGYQPWMNKFISICLTDIMLYGLLIQCFDGSDTIMKMNNESYFPNRVSVMYLPFIINSITLIFCVLSIVYFILFNKQKLILPLWSMTFIIITISFSIFNYKYFNKGKDEIKLLNHLNEEQVYQFEEENLCCLDLIHPNCGCYQFEGKQRKICDYTQRVPVCYERPIHCYKCIQHSNNLFLLCCLHNCVLICIYIYLCWFLLKKLILNFKNGDSTTIEGLDGMNDVVSFSLFSEEKDSNEKEESNEEEKENEDDENSNDDEEEDDENNENDQNENKHIKQD